MSESSETSIPYSEAVLSSELKERSDADIQTFSSLQNYAKEQGLSFVLASGYAVDAHLGGRITRSHRDMDGIFLLPDTFDYTDIEDEIREILHKESTPWRFYKSEDDLLEFRSEDGNPRILEVRRMSDETDYQVVPGTLIDSKGEKHEFDILSVNDIVVSKVNIISLLESMSKEEQEQQGYGELEDHDRKDFHHLINHSSFDKDKVIDLLVEGAPENLGDDEAKLDARNRFERASIILATN